MVLPPAILEMIDCLVYSDSFQISLKTCLSFKPAVMDYLPHVLFPGTYDVQAFICSHRLNHLDYVDYKYTYQEEFEFLKSNWS